MRPGGIGDKKGRWEEGRSQADGETTKLRTSQCLAHGGAPGKAPVLDAVGSNPMINWEPPGAPHLQILQGSLGISFSNSVAKDTGG